MEIKTENPWCGKDLEQFLFYCCPECDTKNKSRDGFMKHITQHPDALEFIKDVKVMKGRHATLDKEAVRVVKSMPKWVPGKQRGKSVNSRFTLPVKFKIQ